MGAVSQATLPISILTDLVKRFAGLFLIEVGYWNQLRQWTIVAEGWI
jgi:hypothetical protein